MNTNKKLLVGAFILLLIVIVFFNISRNDNKQKNEIVIGAILPITGNLSFLGEPEYNILKMAKDQKEREGYKVTLLFEDSKGDVKEGLTSINRLIAKKVDAIIVATTGVSKAVLPIADRNKIPIFVQCMDPNITKDSKYAFRIFPNYREEQKLIVDYIQEKNLKTVSLFYSNTGGIKPEADEFINHSKQINLQLLSIDTFEPNQTDFRNVLIKIKSLKPEVIVVLGYGQNYPPIIKQIRELNIKNTIIGNVALEQKGAEELGFEIYEGIIFPSFSVAQKNKSIDSLRKHYYDIFKKYPGGFLDYPYFYDAFNAIVNAKIQNKVENDEILKRLQNIEFISVTGYKIDFSKSNDYAPPLALGMYQNGKVLPLK